MHNPFHLGARRAPTQEQPEADVAKEKPKDLDPAAVLSTGTDQPATEAGASASEPTQDEPGAALFSADCDQDGNPVRPFGTPKEHKPFLASMYNHDTRLVFAKNADEARAAGFRKWGVVASPYPVTVVPFTGKLVDGAKPLESDDRKAKAAELRRQAEELEKSAA
jgi:hypothetical protein